MKKETMLLSMLLLMATTSALVFAQTAEGDQIISKTTGGINEILRIGIAIFWVLFGLAVVGAGAVYVFKKDDPEARKELMAKIRGWIIGALLVSLSLTIVGLLRKIWG